MPSLLDLYSRLGTDAVQGAKVAGNSLMEFYNKPVADRASMLPIGQYEDGSLTFAVPGMIKDTYDSLVNSYGDVAAGRTPRTQDVLNVASAPMMGNFAAKAAGIMPEGALGVGASKPPTGAAHQARFDAFRNQLDSLNPADRATWRGSLRPENYAVSSPFEVISRPQYADEVRPFEGDVDLRSLKTKQESVRGFDVQDIAATGVDENFYRAHNTGMPKVRRLADGTYMLVDGNHRMSAEVLKGNDTARAMISANAPEGSLLSLAQQFLNQDERQR
jgi:hypothetical protein